MSFIKGIILGSAVCTACFLGYAYGTQVEEKARGEVQQCDVYVGYGRITFGRRCNFNRVMVGREESYIYCADIEVECPVPRKDGTLEDIGSH